MSSLDTDDTAFMLVAAAFVLLITLVNGTIGVRSHPEEEHEGLHLTEHGERGYHELA